MVTMALLFDEVAGNYSAPIAFANDASAIRYLKVIKAKDPIIKDLKLYKMGEFDPNTGKLVLLPEYELLVRGDQLENETNA